MEAAECSTFVPPGFRFHPTEEELVGYYLSKKIASKYTSTTAAAAGILQVIADVDLYRIEPWHLREKCNNNNNGASTAAAEWYFFSYRDRKYPTGTRTNRATAAGFWKATGRDKAVVSSKKKNKGTVIGMRKTLVFYSGRAPNGRKTDWIIHEYRLQTTELGPPQEEGWVVCRAFKKQVITSQRPQSFIDTYLPLASPYGFETLADQHYRCYSNSSSLVDPFRGGSSPERQTEAMQTPQAIIDADCAMDGAGVGSEHGRRFEGNDCKGAIGEDAGVDWGVLDQLLASQILMDESTSCSFL